MSAFTDPVWQISLGIAFTVALTIRAWITHRTTLARERARTDRLHAAIDGTDPRHRPDILRACHGLECPAPEPADPPEPDSAPSPSTGTAGTP